MIKALVVGLGLALSFGVASAQSKKPARKKPVHAPAAGSKKPDSKADTQPSAVAQPDGTPPAAKDGTLPAAKDGTLPVAQDGSLPDVKDPKLPAAPDASSPPATKADPPPTPGPKADANPQAAKAGGNSSDVKHSAPMKTDEKVSTTQALEKSASSTDYRNVSPADEQAALIAFRAGNAMLNDGLFKQAAAKYREALSHWNHPAIHYNLALALINLDQPIEVFDELTSAMAYGPGPLGGKEKHDHANEYMRLVQGQLADIEVSCDKIGAKVSVDGKEVFIAPGKFKQKVRVGKHTFYADKQGYNARITAPYIGPGETFRVELKLYTVEETTRYRRKWQNTWFPYAVLGAGAVVGLAAGGFELSAQSSYNQFNARVAACNTMVAGCPTATPGITPLRDSGNSKRLIGFVGYGAAGAAAATGAVLLWLNRRRAYQISPEELEAETAPLAVAPIVSPDVLGATVQGHF